MKVNKLKISDRAVGPVVPVSYKNIAKRRARANGGEAPSVVDFLNEQQRGQTIEATLVNTSTTESKVIALFPGMLKTVAEIAKYAGVTADAIAKEGVVLTGANDATIVSCTSQTLDLAQRWIDKHPMRFCKLKLQTTSAAQDTQFAKEISFYGFALGKKTGDVKIRPQDYVRSDQFNRNIVEIDLSMQLDDATVMLVELAPNSSLSLALQVVAEMNTTYALSDMVDKLED